MAIPQIAIPTDIPFLRSFPKLIEPTSQSAFGGRAMSYVQYADSFWSANMITAPLTNALRYSLEAFLDRANPTRASVIYTPTAVCLPRAYWGDENNAAVLNTGTITTITSGNVLAIGSVTNGLTLQPGDLISASNALNALLLRVTVGGVASGGSITVTVAPFLPSYIIAGAVVTFKKPFMLTRVVPGSYNIDDSQYPTASFQLQEVPQ